MDAYRALERRFARIAAIEDALGILQWDMQTMMPAGAIAGRSEQLATLKVLAHELLIAPETGDLIGEAKTRQEGLDDWQRANLREIHRRHQRAAAVPASLVEASTRAAAVCQHAWEAARPANDFAAVRAPLAEIVGLQKETGAALGAALGLDPYDALLDLFDLGSTRAALDPLFAPLKAELPDLLGRALERQSSAGAVVEVRGPFPGDVQEKLGRRVLDGLGFDFARGRLDVSAHPFTGGAFGDVRITTRYDDKDFVSGLMAIIHEGGHALYEQNRPAAWRGQPVGESRGMSVHESQSLSFEMQAGLSPEFFSFLAPLARDAFNGTWSADDLHRSAIAVEPGFIRVEADEVTYPAHILLRYDIEKAVMSGDLALDDLPGAFNEVVKKLLGLAVPDDRRGCLQDIHWYAGYWGYFPTYLVGAMIAAQLVVTAKAAEPELFPALTRGDFGPLRRWMTENVHSKGSSLDRDALIQMATGRPLDGADHRRHLADRYCS